MVVETEEFQFDLYEQNQPIFIIIDINKGTFLIYGVIVSKRSSQGRTLKSEHLMFYYGLTGLEETSVPKSHTHELLCKNIV